MSSNQVKKIPYGISDFERVNDGQYYYFDKTNYISILEDLGSFLFLIRPRRFGKSLLLSMLESYYDIAKKDQFEEFFKNTAIKDNPTKERNSYLILKLNFSKVEPDLDEVKDSFEEHNQAALYTFLRKYKKYFEDNFINEIENYKSFAGKFDYLIQYCSLKGLKLYVLLDEYDNFANTILTNYGKEHYHNLTHGSGFFRYFFNILKAATTDSGAALSRLFITGVSPLTMDDVTSGFNIGTFISLTPRVNELLGLTDEDVREILRYYIDNGAIAKEDEEKHYQIMSQWYNNYQFCNIGSNIKKVFNTDMVLYYIRAVIELGCPPEKLIDVNVKTDYKKLKYLITLDKKLNGNFDRLRNIINTGKINSEIVESFSVESLTDKDNFISLLYYFGLLTIRSGKLNIKEFSIPNLVIKNLYYGYIREALKDVKKFKILKEELEDALENMALKGNWQ